MSDLANFFCVDAERIRACWDVDEPDAMVQIALERNQGMSFEAVKKHLEGLVRNEKFWRLLPRDIAVKHCQEWPRPRQEFIP